MAYATTAVGILNNVAKKINLTATYSCIDAKFRPPRYTMQCVVGVFKAIAVGASKKAGKEGSAAAMLRVLAQHGYTVPSQFAVVPPGMVPPRQRAPKRFRSRALLRTSRFHLELKAMCDELEVDEPFYQYVRLESPPLKSQYKAKVTVGEIWREATAKTLREAEDLAAEKLCARIIVLRANGYSIINRRNRLDNSDLKTYLPDLSEDERDIACEFLHSTHGSLADYCPQEVLARAVELTRLQMITYQIFRLDGYYQVIELNGGNCSIAYMHKIRAHAAERALRDLWSALATTKISPY